MNTPIKRPVGRPRKTPKPVVGTRDGLRRAASKAQMQAKPQAPYTYPIRPPALMTGVVPEGQSAPVMAQDSNPYAYALQGGLPGGGFPGFQYLAQLATRAEYRAFASTMSTELTREWIEFNGSDDTADKIKDIEAEFDRLHVRDVIHTAAAHDCYFGRGQIMLTMRGGDNEQPLILDKRTVKIGSLDRLSAVEAVWTTPSAYNSIDPTAPDFYKPVGWFVLGKQVHASRLMTIITRPLPDILKPAFNFAGMSLSQLAEPYVDNWLRTRQSVSDLINNFSITILSTAMGQILQGDDDGQDLFKRADLFTAMRSNKGLMVLDKESEELGQVNTPLSGLHELQAQSQEQMCTVSRIPAVILTGLSPGGLNASSDGEIRVFYDWIAAQQDAYWRAPIKTILDLVQLSLFGEIDPDINFNFVPLYQMTPAEEAEIRAKDGVTDVGYINAGVVDPSEVREKLAKDPTSGFDGLDLSLIIVPPEEPDDVPPEGGEPEPAQDSNFEEGKHPRSDNGQFGSGGGKASEAAGESDDWLSALFAETGSVGVEPTEKTKPVELNNVKSDVEKYIESTQSEAEKWAAKNYKANGKQIEMKGDGPTKNASLSVGAINEARKNKAVSALGDQIGAAKKLLDKIESGHDLSGDLSEIQKAVKNDIKRDGGVNKAFGSERNMLESYISRTLLNDARGAFGKGSLANAIANAAFPDEKT